MTVSLIAALAEDRVIGNAGDLPWSVPEDMKFFMRTTTGHAVIMGRKTWESMKKRPLPKRTNIVVTRQPGYVAEGAVVAPDIESALAKAKEVDADPFVIGGAEIYALALPHADKMYLTYIAQKVPGDTHFPAFSDAEWKESERRPGETAGVTFVTYERKQDGPAGPERSEGNGVWAKLAGFLFLLGAASVVAPNTGCKVEAANYPVDTCTKSCVKRAARQCSEDECNRGCHFILDRIAEKEGDVVIGCVASRDQRCGDVVWAQCAARVGTHADGGPPAPPPPNDEWE